MLLDVTRLIWRRWQDRRPTGIDRVCLAYLRHYRHRAQAVVHLGGFRRILDKHRSAAVFDAVDRPNSHFRVDLMGALLRSAATIAPRGAGQLYLNAGHTGLDRAGFRRWLETTGVKPVYFVHDLIPITHPEFCRAGERERHIERMTTVLKTGTGVIGNSNVTIANLVAFGESAGLELPPTLTALLGSGSLQGMARHEVADDEPTFVILGTIEARKNHLLLLHLWARLVERLKDKAPRLLIIGQRGWECEQVLDFLERGLKIRSKVVELNQCDDQALKTHLANARALLFPSVVEGYGLPLAEALASGTPVIASDLPAFREISGDIPEYLDPLDGPAWEKMILQYSEVANPRREAQIKRIGGFTAPTWSQHFAAVDAWLETLS